MTLLDLVLMRYGGLTARQLGIEEPERDGPPAPLRLKGVIDSKPGRVYSRDTERRLERANGREKQTGSV